MKEYISGWMLPRPRSIHSLLILILLSGLPTVARADGGGSIAGTVKDPSGGVVPKATITATNIRHWCPTSGCDQRFRSVLLPRFTRRSL